MPEVKFSCPKCSQHLEAPEEALGKTVQCPSCNETITVPVATATVASAPPPQRTKTCPFCSEQILLDAKKCKHCGETVDVALRVAEEAKRAHDKPMVFMNAGGGGAAASASSGGALPAKHNFPHGLHFIATLFTAGLWLPIWILHYIFRSRSYYN